MPIVNVNPEDMKKPVEAIDGGQYGPGMQNDAELKLIDFEFPATGKNLPGYDKDGKEGPHAYFSVQINLANGATAFARKHVDVMEYLANDLTALGVNVMNNGDAGISFNDEEVVGSPIGGIELKDKRPDKNDKDKWYTGDIKRFIAA